MGVFTVLLTPENTLMLLKPRLTATCSERLAAATAAGTVQTAWDWAAAKVAGLLMLQLLLHSCYRRDEIYVKLLVSPIEAKWSPNAQVWGMITAAVTCFAFPECKLLHVD